MVDINMGCPVRKVTKTGAGSMLLGGGAELGARVVAAVAEAVDVPVTVKMRRGERNDSRDFLIAGPRFVEAGAQALTLHPRSAKQMYTGHADHTLTAELVAQGWTLVCSQVAPEEDYGSFSYVRSPSGFLLEPVAEANQPRMERWFAGGSLS